MTLTNLWNAIRAQLTPSRVVPLTGHLLAALVGLGTAWLATKGWLSLDSTQVLAIVVPIVTGVEGTILHWQVGQREYAARGNDRQRVVEDYDTHPDDLVPDVNDLTGEKAKAREEKAIAKHEKKKKGK